MVSAISNNNLYPANSLPTNFQQRRSEWQQLAQDIQSGDLAGAQKACAALTENASNASQALNGPPAGQSNPLAQDFSAVGQALQSGDLAGAQQAFAKLQQDAQQQFSQAGHAHGRHHHHGHGQESSLLNGTSTSTTSSDAAAGNTSPGTTGLDITG